MYEKVGNILKMAQESNTSVISFICQDYVMALTTRRARGATRARRVRRRASCRARTPPVAAFLVWRLSDGA